MSKPWPNDRLFLQSVGGALVLSLASVVINSTRSAGMGTHRSYGYPRPFYFHWEGFERSGTNAGINWLYFVENWLIYAVALAAILLVVRAVRGTSSKA
jgi:hypothetical protein